MHKKNKINIKIALLINYIIALGMGSLFIIFNPHPQGPWGFDGYNILGNNLAKGEGFVGTFRMPGYPVLLAIFFKTFGYRYLPVLIFQAFLNAFICISIFYLIKDIFTQKLAIFISFLVAFIGTSNIYVSTLSTDMMTTFLIVISVLCLYIGYRKNLHLFYFIHGILLSLAILMRPSMVILPFFYFFSLLFILRQYKKAVKYLFFSILGISLLLFPWIIRNYILTRHIIVLTTQGWSQLFYGAMESGKFFESRTYNPYHDYQDLNTYRSLAKDYLTFTAITGFLPENKIPTLKLFYAFDNDRFYRAQEMTYVSDNKFEYKVPRLSKSKILKYYIEVSDGQHADRFPLGAPEVNHLFYNRRSDSDDFDKDDGNPAIIDVFDFVAITRQVLPYSSRNISVLDDYDYNNDKKIDKTDLLILSKFLLQDKSEKISDSFGDIEIKRENSGIKVSFLDNSNMYIPDDIKGSKLYIIVNKGLAFDIFNNKYFINSKLRNVNSKWQEGVKYKIIDLGIDRGNLSGLNRQSLWRKLFIFYVKDHIKDYSIAVLKKMFRMWITVGSKDVGVSYPPPGGRYYLFTLAKFFSLSIFLLCVAGVFILRNRLKEIIFILVPIIYFPLTHSWYMVNARHTLPANPFVLIFVGVSIYSFAKLLTNIIRGKR
ncbi:MAG: glycosyltransferase family 39 protein [Candidatus Omnitrophota bacterium]|nr:glycosyltransferase family 39 protein [Candidatus Omnitrophota bacterium]